MLTLTVIDSDRWIANGIAQYFSERNIRVNIMTDAQGEDVINIAAGSDVVISELCTFGLDVQAVAELYLRFRRVSPHTRLIFLTDLNEKAITQYITVLLPGARVLSKRCEIKQLANEIFGHALRPAEESPYSSVRHKSSVLTPREFGLLRLLATSASLTDIGRKLQLSVKTVSQHRKNIMRKLNCRTSVELVPRLVRMGFTNKGA